MKIHLGFCGNIAGEQQPHEGLRHRFTPRHVCRQLLLTVRNGHTSEANSLRGKSGNAPIIPTVKEKPRFGGYQVGKIGIAVPYFTRTKRTRFGS